MSVTSCRVPNCKDCIANLRKKETDRIVAAENGSLITGWTQNPQISMGTIEGLPMERLADKLALEMARAALSNGPGNKSGSLKNRAVEKNAKTPKPIPSPISLNSARPSHQRAGSPFVKTRREESPAGKPKKEEAKGASVPSSSSGSQVPKNTSILFVPVAQKVKSQTKKIQDIPASSVAKISNVSSPPSQLRIRLGMKPVKQEDQPKEGAPIASSKKRETLSSLFSGIPLFNSFPKKRWRRT